VSLPNPLRMKRLQCWMLLLAVAIPSLAGAGDIAWKNVGPGGGGWIQSLAFDPRDPETIYLGCDVGGFYISRDAGRTWTIQNTGLTDYFVEGIAVHPRDSRILLLGCEGGVFKSTDQGAESGRASPSRGATASLRPSGP
jgi:photosystem II stability/assembly factor-like uncharacterized protein